MSGYNSSYKSYLFKNTSSTTSNKYNYNTTSYQEKEPYKSAFTNYNKYYQDTEKSSYNSSSNPIKYYDNSTIKKPSETATKSNPIKVLDEDQARFFSHPTVNNSSKNQYPEKYFSNYNRTSYLDETTNSKTNLNMNLPKKKFKIGDIIFIGRNSLAYNYLGRSGSYTLAIDNNGTIHYIPDGVQII